MFHDTTCVQQTHTHRSKHSKILACLVLMLSAAFASDKECAATPQVPETMRRIRQERHEPLDTPYCSKCNITKDNYKPEDTKCPTCKRAWTFEFVPKFFESRRGNYDSNYVCDS